MRLGTSLIIGYWAVVTASGHLYARFGLRPIPLDEQARLRAVRLFAGAVFIGTLFSLGIVAVEKWMSRRPSI